MYAAKLELTAHEQKVHDRAMSCAKQYRRAEGDLMAAIDAAHLVRVYEKFGLLSCFMYCLKMLELPEAAAQYFSTVAKKSREVPALREAIVRGEVQVSKAARICSVISVENQDDWLGKAKNLSKHELEKEVAKARPGEKKRSVVKPVAENRTRIAFDADDDFLRDLRRVTDLESQRTKGKSEIPEALRAALKSYIHKHDPVKKAERAQKRAARAAKATDDIPAANRHHVNLRDQGQCCVVNEDGTRCAERKWLDVHHVVPRCAGGSHAVGNLVTLCRFHHAIHHRGPASGYVGDRAWR